MSSSGTWDTIVVTTIQSSLITIVLLAEFNQDPCHFLLKHKYPNAVENNFWWNRQGFSPIELLTNYTIYNNAKISLARAANYCRLTVQKLLLYLNLLMKVHSSRKWIQYPTWNEIQNMDLIQTELETNDSPKELILKKVCFGCWIILASIYKILK